MNKIEKIVIAHACDELTKGDSGNTGYVIYELGLLIGRNYNQFKPSNDGESRISIENVFKKDLFLHKCSICNENMTLVRPGKYQCDNEKCNKE